MVTLTVKRVNRLRSFVNRDLPTTEKGREWLAVVNAEPCRLPSSAWIQWPGVQSRLTSAAARIAQGLERDGLDARVDDRMVEDLDAALVGVSLRAGPDLEPALGRLRDDLRGSRGRSLREVISEVR